MDLFTALFGSPHGFIRCPCGAIVENTIEARNAHLCYRIQPKPPETVDIEPKKDAE